MRKEIFSLYPPGGKLFSPSLYGEFVLLDFLIGFLEMAISQPAVRSVLVGLILSVSITSLGCAAKKAEPVNEPLPSEETLPVKESENLNKKMLLLAKEPLQPDEREELLDTAAGNFFYGPGLGESAINIAGMVAFPPYALVVAGNSLLSLSGYEPLSIKRVLPEETGEDYQRVMDGIYSGPGRVVAAASDKEYIGREESEERWREFVDGVEQNRALRDEEVSPSFFFASQPVNPRFFHDEGYHSSDDNGRNNITN